MKIIQNRCIRCKEELYVNEASCSRCGESTSMADTYLKGIKKVEEKDLKSQLEKLLQPLVEADKQNESKWKQVLAMLASITGEQILPTVPNMIHKSFSMSTLLCSRPYFS